MYKYLDKVNSPKDIKEMSIEKLDLLAKDIRKFLLKSISKTGGHLASNLGVVELTLSLHKVFNSPKDKIVWDVGHQSYVHKILTGRKDEFTTLRQFSGLSGFPKENESPHDIFDTGHSSTSISIAEGLACARDIKNEDSHIIAVIGDGSITGGMALEALNHVGYINADMTIILNDNEMSIDKNVGGLANHLSSIINKSKDNTINNIISKESSFFEDIGIKYYGPIDGHNTKDLIDILNTVKNKKGPKLLHVVTKKGKGYKYAEEAPDKYHGVSKFDIKEGIKPSISQSISSQVGKKLIKMAHKDNEIVAVTAAMPSGTGLNLFEREYPDRFYDVGIAEQHAATFCAGLAKSGIKPYFAVYSTFLQRAYDQVIHDVCITKKNVTFLIDRAGIVGNDGETHHGMFDLSYLNIIPNIIVMAPKDSKELDLMMDLSLDINLPMAIRYPRGNSYELNLGEYTPIKLGTYEVISKGEDIAILAIGTMVKHSIEAKQILINDNINPTIVNARFLKPMDENLLHKIFKEHKTIITIEDNVIDGGFGSRVNKFMVDNNYKSKIINIGLPDEFVQHGNAEDIYEYVGLSSKCIAKRIKSLYYER